MPTTTPLAGQKSLWSEDDHPREQSAHDDRRPGEFAPKDQPRLGAPSPPSPSRLKPPAPPAGGGDKKAIEEQVVSQNMGLVGSIVNRVSTPQTRDNLMQVGAQAMLQAWREFDPSRGNQFSTFAVPYIRNAVTNEMQKESRRGRAGSLSADPNDGGRDPWQDVEDKRGQTPDSEAGERELLNQLSSILQSMPPQDADMLVRYYGGETQQSIASSLGVSQPTVLYRLNKLLQSLRERMKGSMPYSRLLDWGMILEQYARKVHRDQRNFFDQYRDEEFHRKPFREELHPRESTDYGSKHKGQFANKHGKLADIKISEQGPGQWIGRVMHPHTLEEITHKGDSHEDVMRKAHKHGNENGYLVRPVAKEPDLKGLFEGESAGDSEPLFELDRPEPEARRPKFEGAPKAKQTSMFDAGREDLPGQSLLFNTDPGNIDDPTTMESKVKKGLFQRDRRQMERFERMVNQHLGEHGIQVDQYGILRSAGRGITRAVLAGILMSLMHSSMSGETIGQRQLTPPNPPQPQQQTSLSPPSPPSPQGHTGQASGRSSGENGNWITIGGHSDGHGHRHSGGAAVQVDDSGEIQKGPAALKGKDLDELDQNPGIKGAPADQSTEDWINQTQEGGSEASIDQWRPAPDEKGDDFHGPRERLGPPAPPPQEEVDPFAERPQAANQESVDRVRDRHKADQEFKALHHTARKKLQAAADEAGVDVMDLFRQVQIEHASGADEAASRMELWRDAKNSLGVNAADMRRIENDQSWRGGDLSDFKVGAGVGGGMDEFAQEATGRFPGMLDADNASHQIGELLRAGRPDEHKLTSPAVIESALKHLEHVRHQKELDEYLNSPEDDELQRELEGFGDIYPEDDELEDVAVANVPFSRHLSADEVDRYYGRGGVSW